ncbi:DUF4823 domain-containing protein [bacterium endosymbiont of Bathymodiolus sp. 5 South]|jgi:hypothetical protein|uniref:DUF4823 domain-containing protein n=1 Tax=bacterium endosymbiont of Bathymodiolus sp. 5 South TaxID=1181670 RepID=UPI0010B1133C|nr:DUF4823 domain-containing protein [bacterium endosymbiont of Bathymodiolus sp. 5 South]CAC9443028.1 hypothetical protein [uncultured Gammaproteobacteria bacterium]CAC9447676.1 hypothetical protein [uncultured Gammaproteobacteria bacterium]CAC9480479.1 hypothetical protein [uncultured Gammaproteobacteria bacterium]CAC9635374.1 hypothetical protein [uncultured Gammaproteobacteria bacterium]CAC9658078.1 hypothetical protein [uncultured Gammaproteobacteria bacterium]
MHLEKKSKVMRYFVILGIVVFLGGCTTDSYQLLRTKNVSIKLESSKSVYISIPRDGRYGQINYQGSGANASQIILMAFSKNSNSAETGRQYQSFDNALTHAKENNYGYLVFPTILEWEDRATEWSGIPDKASIKIAIINTESGKTMDSVIIKGKSGLATFGGDHPQDLLAKPVSAYINGLY